LISARALGAESYGDVASLLAIAGVMALPLGAVQIVVAREVASSLAEGRDASADRFTQRALRGCGIVGGVVAALLLLISPIVAHELDISSTVAVAFTALYALPAFVTPGLWGLAQGLQRFKALSVSMGLPQLLRVVVLAVFLAAGLGVGGALAATFVAAVIGVGIPAWLVRDHLTRGRQSESTVSNRHLLRSLSPVIIGLLAITSLTTIDVVVAKAALSSHEAGIYASASLVGRLILYLPAAIVTVLLPKVSSRIAAGEDAAAIVSASLGVTFMFCLGAIIVYSTVPSLLATVAFGSGFSDVSSLLPLFAIVMTGYAILNVLLAYHLGKGSNGMSYLLAAGAIGQLLVFAVFHSSAHEMLVADLAVAVALLLAHELILEPTIVRSASFISHQVARRRQAFSRAG
jgi:O-antigen/teichoic acid export membrane protein